jgi:hypothetical protein
VKLVRILSRLALLSVAAAAFVGLTEIYGGSGQAPMPDPSTQAERRHRPSAPHVNLFPEFIGEGMLLALYALGGRIVFRLRLSPVSRTEGRPISLDLHRERRTAKA